MPADIAAEIEAARCTLDVREGEPVATHRVDYEATLGAKLRLARALFDRLPPGELERDEGFRRFCADSWEWLQPYAVFLVLRRVFGTCEHWRWGALSHPTQEVGRLVGGLAGQCRGQREEGRGKLCKRERLLQLALGPGAPLIHAPDHPPACV